jgi:hypothetical protein
MKNIKNTIRNKPKTRRFSHVKQKFEKGKFDSSDSLMFNNIIDEYKAGKSLSEIGSSYGLTDRQTASIINQTHALPYKVFGYPECRIEEEYCKNNKSSGEIMVEFNITRKYLSQTVCNFGMRKGIYPTPNTYTPPKHNQGRRTKWKCDPLHPYVELIKY